MPQSPSTTRSRVNIPKILHVSRRLSLESNTKTTDHCGSGLIFLYSHPDSVICFAILFSVISKEDGSFRLENMTAGTYTIRVNKELMFFEPITVKIAPNTPQLPDIITTGYVWSKSGLTYGHVTDKLRNALMFVQRRFSVCGQISISHLPEGMKQQGRYKVTLTQQGQDKASSRTVDSDPQGAFCFQAKPGDYSVHVRLRQHVVFVEVPITSSTWTL